MHSQEGGFSRAFLIGIVLLTAILFAGTLAAQTSPTSAPAVNDQLARLDQRVTAAQSSADNAWMLVSAALVLMMTGPGLALFYGGLVRQKNVLALMMQSFALMAIITVLWGLFGYSLSFGPGNSFIGGFRNRFLKPPIKLFPGPKDRL